MANERGLNTPTAPAQVAPQPERLMVRNALNESVEASFGEPNIEKMAPEKDAAHVTTLDDDAFRKALDLGTIQKPAPTEKADTSDLELPEEAASEGETAQEAASAAVPPAKDAPEAPVEIPTLSRAPETPFAVADAEGEVEIPDLFFSFKANGKDYERVPVDKLVRFAQMGIYNADKEAKYRDVDLTVGTLERRASMAESRVQELEKFYERLLSDPSYYDQASELYQQQNTPEQRIARSEAQMQAMQAQFELEREELRRAARQEAQQSELQSRYTQERESAQLQTFVKTELAPSLERLMQSNPLLTEQEVLGQYTLLTAPLMVGGRIPPSRLSEVKALVDHELTNWVVGVSADRQFAKTQADKRVQAAKAAATQAKRQVARAAAPTGSPAALKPTAPKKYDDVDSWLRDGGGVLPPLVEHD